MQMMPMFNELSDEEITALIRLRKDLKDGAILFIGDHLYFDPDLQGPAELFTRYNFSMETVRSHGHLYHTGCIGGLLMQYLHRKDWNNLSAFIESRQRFKELCFGMPTDYDWHTITPTQAVEAIDNYMFSIDGIWKHL